MKNSIKSVAAIVLALALPTAQIFANGNSTIELSDSAWQEIEASAELDHLTDIEEIPVVELDQNNSLGIDFKPGNFSNLLLDAPFNQKEQVGIVVFDAQGEMVHSAAGVYADLRDLHFVDYYNFDMTYVVKVYSDTQVYEAKVQVVYR